jgi:deoxyribodipyrimidine photo-lyase
LDPCCTQDSPVCRVIQPDPPEELNQWQWKTKIIMTSGIHWFRRDLRLDDNTALNLLAKKAGKIYPVYIVGNPVGAQHWSGSRRQSLLCRNLQSLDRQLKNHGSQLIVRYGNPVDELDKLARRVGASHISYNRDYDPFGWSEETKVRIHFKEKELDILDAKDRVLHETTEVRTKAGKPFVVFSPFYNVWRGLEKPCPQTITAFFAPHPDPGSLPTPQYWGMENVPTPEAGTKGAEKRLQKFLDQGLVAYDDSRNLPSRPSSGISLDLRFGTISPRQAWDQINKMPDSSGRAAYLRQLAWREFFLHLLYNHPRVLHEEFDPKFIGMPWLDRPDQLLRWQEGMTGFPIVDAAMRELRSTGFMHNRARMIVSMFLTKDLHLDWRSGEKFFMQQLLDGEIASNNGGWQWSAGTGADAAPYFRIQNPWLQTKRFDRQGIYIKTWVPELKDVSPDKLWRHPETPLCSNYPLPMVDHAKEKKVTMEMFRRHLNRQVRQA